MGKIFYKDGQRYTNNRATEIELVRRISHSKWLAKTIEHNFEFEINQGQLLHGQFKTPSCKSVYGVGYFGVGDYRCRGLDGKITLTYSVWSNMLKRCYTDYVGNKTPDSYANASVCNEWHNFQVFAKWFSTRVELFISNDVVPKLDKDLIGNSRLYSPSDCCILPNILNCSIIDSRVNSKVHIGVSEINGKYAATVTHNYKSNWLGVFDTESEAVRRYIEYKKEILTKLAEDYKHVLDDCTRTRLLNWNPNNEQTNTDSRR